MAQWCLTHCLMLNHGPCLEAGASQLSPRFIRGLAEKLDISLRIDRVAIAEIGRKLGLAVGSTSPSSRRGRMQALVYVTGYTIQSSVTFHREIKHYVVRTRADALHLRLLLRKAHVVSRRSLDPLSRLARLIGGLRFGKRQLSTPETPQNPPHSCLLCFTQSRTCTG